MCDPYQPCEKELRLTRRCLELLEQYGFGATVITKSDLVLRDMDLFCSINRKAKAVIQMSMTIMDGDLSSKLEPGVCNTRRRYEVLKEFQKRGVTTVVWMMPLLPFLTDTKENFDALLDCCFDAGVKGIVCFNIGMTLRRRDREYYYRALDRLFPGMAGRYRDKYGDAYELASDSSAEVMEVFHRECEKRGILHTPDACFRYTGTFPEKYQQMSLFDLGGLG